MLSVTFPASPRKLRLFVLLKALGLGKSDDIFASFGEEPEIHNDVLINMENLLVRTAQVFLCLQAYLEQRMRKHTLY